MFAIEELLFVLMCGRMAGCTHVTEIADWAAVQLDWLREQLPYAPGAPSHDTLSRVLTMVKTEEMEGLFRQTMARVSVFQNNDLPDDTPRHLALDGKFHNGHQARGQSKTFFAHAYDATHDHLVDWSVVADKSNEKSGIRTLLDRLPLKKTLITMDAMGTHAGFLHTIVEGGGDAILALKGNQGHLCEAMTLWTQKPSRATLKGMSSHTTREAGHGRVEERETTVFPLPNPGTKAREGLMLSSEWDSIASLVVVKSTRTPKGRSKVKATEETRLFLSTLNLAKASAAEPYRGMV